MWIESDGDETRSFVPGCPHPVRVEPGRASAKESYADTGVGGVEQGAEHATRGDAVGRGDKGEWTMMQLTAGDKFALKVQLQDDFGNNAPLTPLMAATSPASMQALRAGAGVPQLVFGASSANASAADAKATTATIEEVDSGELTASLETPDGTQALAIRKVHPEGAAKGARSREAKKASGPTSGGMVGLYEVVSLGSSRERASTWRRSSFAARPFAACPSDFTCGRPTRSLPRAGLRFDHAACRLCIRRQKWCFIWLISMAMMWRPAAYASIARYLVPRPPNAKSSTVATEPIRSPL